MTKLKNLEEITLPLSETDYKMLQKMKSTGQLKWTDFPRKLKRAYSAYGFEERNERWEKIKHSEYD